MIAGNCFASATLLLCSIGAEAACLPLPDPAFRQLDAEINHSPQRVLGEATERLRLQGPSGDILARAQLLAIVASSDANLDRNEDAKAAIDDGVALLKSVPPGASGARIRLRLELLRSELETVTSNGMAAGKVIDELVAGLPAESLDRACALSQRAIAFDFTDEPDRAVATALKGYRLAVNHGWNVPRFETAYTLAVNFRRAGLYSQAEKMIDEVIAVETAEGMSQILSEALYERGQILVAAERYPDARIALDQSRKASLANGDRLGAAAANIPLCLAQINSHDLASAAVTCSTGRSDLLATGRVDLATLLDSYAARLDLERHQPVAALAILEGVLRQPLHRLLPVQEAQIHRDRGRALGELQRYAEAYAELAQAQSLDAASSMEQRHRQVAVLGALIESEQLHAANRLLTAHVQSQQQDLAHQNKIRLLWATVAVTSIIGCAIVAYMLLLVRGNSRRLRRYEVILRHAGSRSPHAMLLLDENRRVCFANRALLGGDPAPVTGASLADAVPPSVFEQISHAIAAAVEANRSVTLEVALPDPGPAGRHYSVTVLPAIDSNELLGVILQSTDVTELRAVERQLLDHTSRERRKFSGELHEGLAQELAGVLFMLSNLSAVARKASPTLVPLVTEISEQVVRSISVTRRMAQDLAPVLIEGGGSVSDALHHLVGLAQRDLAATVSLDCRIAGCPIADLAADHLYRFCSEALINPALGEWCREVRMQLSLQRDKLVIRIEGDRRPGSVGGSPWDASRIKRMAFLARLLGGAMSVDGGAGGTAAVHLAIPTVFLQGVLPVGTDA